MPYIYSTESDAMDTHKLPNIWVTQLTAHEVAESMEDEILEFSKRPEYRLASMNAQTRDAMLDAMVEELGITGGWCWAYCLPGCLPDSSFFGPFPTYAEAEADAKADAGGYE
jgi:hypothetical protein